MSSKYCSYCDAEAVVARTRPDGSELSLCSTCADCYDAGYEDAREEAEAETRNR